MELVQLVKVLFVNQGNDDQLLLILNSQSICAIPFPCTAFCIYEDCEAHAFRPKSPFSIIYNQEKQLFKNTDKDGSFMALTQATDSSETERHTSVRPHANFFV
jgi:hypothetical protein